jgi:hypothetical protein
MPAKLNVRHAEMQEGPQAFEAFRRAAKQILSVTKSDLPPDPFKKPQSKKRKADQR